MPNLVDYNFIEKMEGFSLKGYVPQSNGTAIGNSGVTIMCGIDLGETTPDALSDMGISDNLVDILTPYCGLKQQAAIDYLNDNPLTLTPDQGNELMTAEFNARYTQLSTIFDKYSDTNFGNLTSAQQTVVFSIFFQYGNLPQRTPHFWNACTSGNWNQVISILKNFGDQYENRRLAEASLLQNS